MKDKKCYKCGTDADLRPINPRNKNLNSCICKNCQNIKAKLYYDKYKDIVFSHYGNVCSCCGESEILFLSIDHTNNDGHLDTNSNNKKVNGRHLYPKIAKLGFPNRYQLLCMNCNFGKRMNNGVCPHKTIDTNNAYSV